VSTPRRTARDDDRSPEEIAAGLKERVYATFTGLAILLAVRAHGEHFDPTSANLSLIIGVVGITLAGFVSDIIAHLVAHRTLPTAREARHMLWVASSALVSLIVPGITLALASFGIIHADLAASIAIGALIVTLALIVLLAVRSAGLRFWQRIFALALLTVLGVAVILLELLAHG